MKIAFFGTPQFAAEILSGTGKFDDIETILVVSQPDRMVGRKKELQKTPVKLIAEEYKIDVLQPDKIKKNIDFHSTLKNLNLDFIVVVAYGKIIPQEILDIPKYGCINIHGSILPKYRGASPVQASIKSGDTETGLTTMYMSAGMDEGDILQIAKVDIDKDDTSENIFEKFIHIGPKLLHDTLQKIVAGKLLGIPQDHSMSTHCGKISREDGEVFFQKQSTQDIYNTFRAYTPWPGIYTFYEGKRLVLEKIQFLEETAPGVESGKIIKNEKKIGIVCKDGKILEIQQLKLEGKKSMDVLSFLNGNKDILEYRFS